MEHKYISLIKKNI